MPSERFAALARNFTTTKYARSAHYAQYAHPDDEEPIDFSSMVARANQRAGKPISKSVVTQKPNFSVAKSGTAKSDQAWRYEGFNIQRAESNHINGRLYTDPKAPGHGTDAGLPRRKIESNFFITISTNKQVPPERVQFYTDKFYKVLEILSQDNYVASWLKYGPKDVIIEGGRFDGQPTYANDNPADVIGSLAWDSNIEVGDERKRMHCHIWLTVNHYSQIQVDVHKLQNAFKTEMNRGLGENDALRIGYTPARYGKKGQLLKGRGESRKGRPYVQVQMLPQSNWTTVMRQYIKKALDSDALPTAFERRAGTVS